MYFYFLRIRVVRNNFIRLFCFVLRIGDNFFDEIEVWEKFRVFGIGDVILFKLIGNNKGVVVIFFINFIRKNVFIGYMMVRFVEVVDEFE